MHFLVAVVEMEYKVWCNDLTFKPIGDVIWTGEQIHKYSDKDLEIARKYLLKEKVDMRFVDGDGLWHIYRLGKNAVSV